MPEGLTTFGLCVLEIFAEWREGTQIFIILILYPYTVWEVPSNQCTSPQSFLNRLPFKELLKEKNIYISACSFEKGILIAIFLLRILVERPKGDTE